MILVYKENTVYVDPFLGCIGWPYDQLAGYAVIIGRSPLARAASGLYDYYFMGEREERNPIDLIEWCFDASIDVKGLEFVHKYSPEHERIVKEWNEPRRGRRFFVYQAFQSTGSLVSYHVTNLMRVAHAGCLHGFKETRAIEELSLFQKSQIPGVTHDKYPIVTALAYAVNHLGKLGQREEFYEDEVKQDVGKHRYATSY